MMAKPSIPIDCFPLAQDDAELPALDWAGLVARMEGDEALARELLTVFWDDTPTQMTALRVALSTNNMQQVCLIAHGLKGACASIGALQMQETCYQLEHLLDNLGSTEATDGAAPLYSNLVAQWITLQSTLPSFLS